MKDIFNKIQISVVPGSLIRKEMTDAEYFGAEYADYISNSRLGLIDPDRGGSPQSYIDGFKAQKNVSAFALGSAIHQMTLESSLYEVSKTTYPNAKLGQAVRSLVKKMKKKPSVNFQDLYDSCEEADYYLTAAKSALETGKPNSYMEKVILAAKNIFSTGIPDKTNDGRDYIYLSEEHFTKFHKSFAGVKANEDIQRVMYDGESFMEDVFLMEVDVAVPKDFNDSNIEFEIIRLKVKIKADNWTLKQDDGIVVLNDLKSTGKPASKFMGYYETEVGPVNFGQEVWRQGSWDTFSYKTQMGIYGSLLNEYVNQTYKKEFELQANMLVVATVSPFDSCVYPVSQEQLKEGLDKAHELIKRVAYMNVYGVDRTPEKELLGALMELGDQEVCDCDFADEPVLEMDLSLMEL